MDVLMKLNVLVILLTSILASCTQIGSTIIRTDRNHYGVEVAKSERSQLLLNIVRLRYLDSIEFLQINSITAQKTRQNSGTAALTVPYMHSDINAFGSTFSFTDAPTVSFTPLQGASFVSSLLTPISFQSIAYLTGTHWDLSKIFLLSIDRINDYHNAVGFIARIGKAKALNYTSFRKVVNYIHILQTAQAIDLEANLVNKKEEQLVIFFNHKREVDTELKLKRLLNISPKADFMIFSPHYSTSTKNNIVSVKTRSIVGVLSYLANAVVIPEDSTFQGTIPHIPDVTIHSSASPVSSTINTYYRGYYYYISENDESSKRSFLMLSDFVELTAGLPGGNNGVVLTLPVGK